VHDFQNSVPNIISKYSLQICGRNVAHLEFIQLYLISDIHVFYVLFEKLKNKRCQQWRMYDSVCLSVCL
jgi:hypothetical protein